VAEVARKFTRQMTVCHLTDTLASPLTEGLLLLMDWNFTVWNSIFQTSREKI